MYCWPMCLENAQNPGRRFCRIANTAMILLEWKIGYQSIAAFLERLNKDFAEKLFILHGHWGGVFNRISSLIFTMNVSRRRSILVLHAEISTILTCFKIPEKWTDFQHLLWSIFHPKSNLNLENNLRLRFWLITKVFLFSKSDVNSLTLYVLSTAYLLLIQPL